VGRWVIYVKVFVTSTCEDSHNVRHDMHLNWISEETRGSQWACNRSPGSKLLSITTQLHCGGHLGGRARLPDTLLEEDHTMTIPSKFGSNWATGSRQDGFLCEFPIGSYVKLSSAVQPSWWEGGTTRHNFGRGPSNDYFTQALVSFKRYMPPPLTYFKVKICPFPLPHFGSIFFAYLWSFRWPNNISYTPEIFLSSTATFKYTYRAPPHTNWTRIFSERRIFYF
jgi:hypothetical protein